MTLAARAGHSRSCHLASRSNCRWPMARGKFLTAQPAALDRLEKNGQVVLWYTDKGGRPT